MKTSCNKVAYSSQKEAVSSIHYIKNTQNHKKIPKRAYYCNLCEGWHMTSLDKENKVRYEFDIKKDRKIIEKINGILT